MLAARRLRGQQDLAAHILRDGLDKNFDGPARELTVTAARPDGTTIAFKAVCRIDTPQEVQYYKNGGILPYVLRSLLNQK